MYILLTQLTADAGEDVEKEEHSSIVGGIANYYNHSGNQSGGSSENWTQYYRRIQQYLSWAYIQKMFQLVLREDMGTGEKFLNRTAMACAVRSRIDKWDLIKLQSFCKVKDTINKTKRPSTDWERIFTNPKSNTRLISNIYKELKKVDSRKIK